MALGSTQQQGQDNLLSETSRPGCESDYSLSCVARVGLVGAIPPHCHTCMPCWHAEGHLDLYLLQSAFKLL
jgi:hypothetical protein